MQDMAPAYSRKREREARLPLTTKFYQAIGGLPDSLKNWGFNTFLLLYYNQVLGLPASWVSIVLTVSIIIDAITDPMVGSYSDGLTSRLGRRHPLMYAAILPLGACLFFVFAPPQNLSEISLLAWLAVFAIGSRVAMTFYLIPWSAMFAELSDDYEERSEILTWRYLVGGLGTVAFTIAVYSVIFPSTEAYTPGHLNPNGYPQFAIWLSVGAMITAFLTTILTQREVPYLLQPVERRPFGIRGTLADLIDALRNRDFMLLFAGLLLSAFLSGTLAAMEIYLNTYFWGFTPEDLRWFALAGLGGLFAFILIPWLQKRFDKKHILVVTMLVSMSNGLLIIGLRFAGVLPENGDPLLLQILLANEFFRLCVLVIIVVMFVSMVADTLDAQEVTTGKRQEGVFSAAIAFSNKAISGFGVLTAGLLLDYIVRFPDAAKPDQVAEDVIFRLGSVIVGLSILYLVPLAMIKSYRLSRSAHSEIRATLEERRRARRAKESAA